MKITLFISDKIYTTYLPEKVKGQIWIGTDDRHTKKLVDIDADNGHWFIRSSRASSVTGRDGQPVKSLMLEGGSVYTLISELCGSFTALACDGDEATSRFSADTDTEITVGSMKMSDIVFPVASVSSSHATLSLRNGEWSIVDNDTQTGTYVNGERISGECPLSYGDTVFIMGLTLQIETGGVSISDPGGHSVLNPDKFIRLGSGNSYVLRAVSLQSKPNTAKNETGGAPVAGKDDGFRIHSDFEENSSRCFVNSGEFKEPDTSPLSQSQHEIDEGGFDYKDPEYSGATTILGVEGFDSKPVPRAPVPKPRLIRVSTGEEIRITKPEFTVGKSSCDYCVTDNKAISRCHATIISRDGKYYIKDNKSTNKTYVAGNAIPPEVETEITAQTPLRLANENFMFTV